MAPTVAIIWDSARGVRVVGVVDNREPFLELHDLPAHLRLAQVPQAFHDLLEVDAVMYSQRHGRQRVDNVVAARHRDRRTAGSACGRETETGLLQTRDLNTTRVDIGIFGQPYRHFPAGEAAGNFADERIVGIVHEEPFGLQSFSEFSLRFCYFFDRGEMLEVDGSDIRDHADGGAGDPAHLRDLARRAHPHLENAEVVVGAEPEKCERQPEKVVVVAGRPVDAVFGLQYLRGEFLCRRLAHAAGNSDQRSPPQPAHVHGEILQGLVGVVDPDKDLVRREIGGRLVARVDDRADGSFAEGSQDEAVPVMMRASDRKEQLAPS